MTDENKPTDGTGTGKPEGNRTFTQEELDAIVKDRLKREQEKYADYASLKEAAQKYAEYQEAQKTELQKAQEAAQRAQAEKDTALKLANERMIRAEFIAAASGLNVAHPEDAFALADRAGVSIADDGKVIGVTEAVKTLVDAVRLPLTTRPKAPDLGGGAGAGDRSGDRQPELTEEERRAALKMGLKPEDYAKSKTKKE